MSTILTWEKYDKYPEILTTPVIKSDNLKVVWTNSKNLKKKNPTARNASNWTDYW